MAYTTGDVLVRATMEAYTGLPEDRVSNDFALNLGGAPDSTRIAAGFDAIDDFYRVVQTSTASVGKYISSYVNRSATHTMLMYDLSGGLPLGSPIATTNWLGPPTPFDTTGLPTEVAGVLSFHADLTDIPEEAGATRPAARRRGRVYIGPLNPAAVRLDTLPYMLGDSAFLTTIRQAGVALLDRTDVTWSVWSRTDSTLRPVVGGWTDNAPDTQRRRGATSTARVTWG